MKIIFLGGLFPPEIRQQIEKDSKGIIQNAANNLQWSVIKGLYYYYKNLTIITLPYIGSYPLNYKKWHLKSSIFNHSALSSNHCIGFINLPFISLISRYLNAKRFLKQYGKHFSENSHIIIYAIHTPFLKAAIDYQRLYPNVKICLIVPDLPQFMSGSGNLFYRLLKRIDAILINRYLEKINSFVLLSDYMAEALKIAGRPYIRIEGIFEQQDSIESVQKEKQKTILYTGTLARRYGIINLLKAFDTITNTNFRLWICGEGDSRNEIEKRAKTDSRIKYFGQLPYREILILQKKATILVNPRTSEGDYTKYSFPSKTMEYLASGTPTILHRIPGIPEEYYQYCYVVNDESIEGLKKAIINVCEKEQSELDEFGRKASKFILEKKNPIFQVKKIYEMLNSID